MLESCISFGPFILDVVNPRGEPTHDWTFVSGENELGPRSLPMITPKLYQSTLCSGLTYTPLAAVALHLGLCVSIESHWHDFQSGLGQSRGGWIVVVKEEWNHNKTSLWE